MSDKRRESLFDDNKIIAEEKSGILDKLENFVKEGESNGDEEVRPEDTIPDLPENANAREFLKKAPSKGLFMPLGQAVKVMQCFRCKAFGHRTNDRECPLQKQGNFVLDSERQAREDPMSVFVAKKLKARQEKYERVEYLKKIMEEIRREEKDRKKRKKEHKKQKKEKLQKNEQ